MAAGSTRDQDAAVGEKRGAVIRAWRRHFCHQRPFAGEHVVKLGGIQGLVAVFASGHKNAAIADHSRDCMNTVRMHRSPGREFAGFEIEVLAAGERNSILARASGDQDFSVGQGGGNVAFPGNGHSACG